MSGFAEVYRQLEEEKNDAEKDTGCRISPDIGSWAGQRICGEF
jgi:hypothetical protein